MQVLATFRSFCTSPRIFCFLFCLLSLPESLQSVSNDASCMLLAIFVDLYVLKEEVPNLQLAVEADPFTYWRWSFTNVLSQEIILLMWCLRRLRSHVLKQSGRWYSRIVERRRLDNIWNHQCTVHSNACCKRDTYRLLELELWETWNVVICNVKTVGSRIWFRSLPSLLIKAFGNRKLVNNYRATSGAG